MRRWGALAVLFALAAPAAATGTRGATAFDFLFLDPTPRPAAMGGAYAAVAGDGDALSYNPAGLAADAPSEASFSHAELAAGLSQDYLALTLRGGDGERLDAGQWLGEGQGAGLYANTLDFGSIQRTTLSNQTGSGLDSFGVRDWAIGAGWASRLPGLPWLAAGAAAKYLRENVDNTVAQTGAADVGLRADLARARGLPVVLGLAVQNMGPDPRFRTQASHLPTALRFGAAWTPLESLTLAADVVQARGGSASPHVGVEWRAVPAASLRLGWDGQRDAGSGIAAGVGLSVSRYRFDYAFAPYGDLGEAHRIGAAVVW